MQTKTKTPIPLTNRFNDFKQLPLLMLLREHFAGWSIKAFLVFLLLSFAAHRLALHYYFSSKGLLLSSAIAGGFGALWWLLEKRPSAKWRSLLALASPAGVVMMLYLVMPTGLNLLFSLAISSLTFGYFLTPLPPESARGGRTELLSLLRPLAAETMIKSMRMLFGRWFLLTLLTKVIHVLTHSTIAAFIPLLGIAVSLTAVHNHAAQRRSNENIAG
ncbi:MAG: hypothetical protein RIR26_438 [Pseudomonadota bacterium]|jgi:hypothetical protein